jgi:hypothetical protein
VQSEKYLHQEQAPKGRNKELKIQSNPTRLDEGARYLLKNKRTERLKRRDERRGERRG